MAVVLLAGVLALALCAGLVVQIQNRPDGSSGVYVDTLRNGFRGPYGSYPTAPTTPSLSPVTPAGYRIGAPSHAAYSQLFGALRIDIDTTTSGADITAVRLGNGTRYWQYHRPTADQLVTTAADVPRADLFLVWRSALPGAQTLSLERIDVRAGRMLWRQQLRVADRTLAKQPAQVVPSASGLTAFLWADLFLGLDRNSGEPRWTYHAPATCVAAPGAALEGSTLVTGLGCRTSSGAAGIDIATGTQRWLRRFVSPQAAPSAPSNPSADPKPSQQTSPTRKPTRHPSQRGPLTPPALATSGKRPLPAPPPLSRAHRDSLPELALRPNTSDAATHRPTPRTTPTPSLLKTTSTPTPSPTPASPKPTPTPSPLPAPGEPTETNDLQTVALGDGRVALPELPNRPIIDVASGNTVGRLDLPKDMETLGLSDDNAVLDGNLLYVLLTPRQGVPLPGAIGIDDLRSGRRIASVPLPSSVQPVRLLAAQDGVLLLSARSGQITLLPSTISLAGQ